MVTKHILITGAKSAGKSTLVERLLAHWEKPVYGFVTRSTGRDERGFHSIYIHPAAGPRHTGEENHIGDCCYGSRTTHPEVFTRLGVQFLRHGTDGILVMDELGFMETGSAEFCREVLGCFDGDTPVLAVCKDKPGVAFLEQVRSHPKAQLYTLTPENREELYHTLLPVLEEWSSHI